jgi:hypothetical protein
LPSITPEIANDIVRAHADAAARMKLDGSTHRQYAYRYCFGVGRTKREIAIGRPGTNEGVTVYINRFSRAGEEYPVTGSGIPGLLVTREYPKGFRGVTGDKGLSSAAASCPTLDPYDNDVLRLTCSDVNGFRKLVRWYTGEISLRSAVGSDPATQTLTAPDDSPGSSDSATGGTNISAPPEAEDFEDEDPRLADATARSAVEQHAVRIAIRHYSGLGFNVEERGKPFDLLCTRPDLDEDGQKVVHVEVKGTTTSGKTVRLTRNEVRDATNEGGWRSDLFVVSRIKLTRNPVSATWETSEGAVKVLEAWSPAAEDLTPTDFVYRMPSASQNIV